MKKKIPWGFLTGVCGVITFYLVAAVVAVFIVLNRIEAETGGGASLFGTWYQILLLVLAVVFLAGTVVLAYFGVKSKKEKVCSADTEQSGELNR